MPPDPPAPAAPPAAPPAEERITALEAEQKRQGGLLEQILARLPGKPPAGGQHPAPDDGATIADLVRQGVEDLERDRARKQKETDADTARADHAERIARLEEARPAENPPTPVGAFRTAVQRRVFGIDDPRK